MNIKLKKIRVKFNEDGDFKSISVDYDKPNENFGGFDHMTILSPEEPESELIKALEKLKPVLTAVAELPKEWDEKLTVTGLTYTHEANEHKKVVIIGKRKSAVGGPLNINSPIRSVTSEDGDNDISILHADLLEEFDGFVIDYLNGRRAQGTLDLEGETEGDE